MIACPACGGAEWHSGMSTPSHRYVACDGCGLLRLDPLPTDDDVAAMYDDSYFTESTTGGYHDYLADEKIHRRNARRHLSRLRRLLDSAPGALLEVGSAAGFLLDEARAQGWSSTGVEIAPIASHAIDELGLDVVGTLAQATDSDARYDAAVLNQVLEHLVDPLGALRTIAGAVRPGGVVQIETWNRASLLARVLGPRWQQVTPPSVVWLFRNQDIERILRNVGLVGVEVSRSTKWVSASTVLGQSTGDDGLVRRLAAGRVGRVALPYHLGDLVVFTARSRAATRGS